MKLRLDHHSGEPIWRQIVEQVKYRVAAGQIEPGAKLPSIRVLAGELEINPRTVVKAYEELQHQQLVVMRQGQGVFVMDGTRRDSVPKQARQKALTEMSQRLLSEGTRMGSTPDEIVEIVRKAATKISQPDS
ncbi:MAG: GntR family transcriptional regulator [Verrucomicrobiales bacterium]|jgi:GntR family transcriptional regulator